MKTTLNISDTVMKQLKQEAALRHQTMSELVESAIRVFLRPRPPGGKLRELPVMRSRMLVDPANREELYRVMGGRW